MQDRPAELAIRTSLATISAASGAVTAGDKALLREHVCAVVDELKAQGWPIENIIIRVKEIGAEAGLGSHRFRPRQPDSIIEEVVKWCIERYYDGAAGVSAQL
jgi:hypothetical protein